MSRPALYRGRCGQCGTERTLALTYDRVFPGAIPPPIIEVGCQCAVPPPVVRCVIATAVL